MWEEATLKLHAHTLVLYHCPITISVFPCGLLHEVWGYIQLRSVFTGNYQHWPIKPTQGMRLSLDALW